MSGMSGTIYVERSNPKNKVKVINMDTTDVWFELDNNSPIRSRPRNVFDDKYTLPEESAFVQHQWYKNDGTYLWVHTRVDYPDSCKVMYLNFEGDNVYTIKLLNLDAFRVLINTYTVCTQVPPELRAEKDIFEQDFEPRKSDPEEKTPGLRF